MNIDLIKNAVTEAYDLLRGEAESVCCYELAEEYERVLSILEEAIDEIEDNDNCGIAQSI